MLRTVSQSARFMRMTNWSRVMPALLTRMSILPKWAIAALKLDLICSSSPTSRGKAEAALPPVEVIWLHHLVQFFLATSSANYGGSTERPPN